jgi:molecular chaperone GrpE
MGKPFDPAFHEAVMQQPTDDCPDNTVIQEMQKGYMLHDRLIRPAMVVVSRAPA